MFVTRPTTEHIVLTLGVTPLSSLLKSILVCLALMLPVRFPINSIETSPLEDLSNLSCGIPACICNLLLNVVRSPDAMIPSILVFIVDINDVFFEILLVLFAIASLCEDVIPTLALLVSMFCACVCL